MELYKLTNQNSETFNKTKWGPGVEHTASGEGPLCSDGWLHAYTDPYVAVLMNPIHANFEDPILWEAEGDLVIDEVLKCGCTRLKTIKQIPLPEISEEQRVRFAIECAKQVCLDPDWNQWADKWISGEDQSRAAAEAAMVAAGAAATWATEAAASWGWATEAAIWATGAAALAAALAAAWASGSDSFDIQLALKRSIDV